MVAKPIALVALAGLVVGVGAGAGAYLALRDNGRTLNPVALETPVGSDRSDSIGVALGPHGGPERGTDVTAAPLAVEATEEVIDPGDPNPAAASSPAPAETLRPPAPPTAEAEREVRRPDPTPPTRPSPVEDAAPPRPPVSDPAPSASRTGPTSLPEAPGWERLSKPWPSRDSDDDPSGPDQVSLRGVDTTTLGSSLPPEEPPLLFEELVVEADSVIGLQVDTPISTDTAEVEDDVEARVTRDVTVDGRVAIPAGARMLGSVVLVERAGQLKGASRLGVRFHTVVLDDIVEVPVVTETVYREAQSQGGKNAAKIGGAAVGGAILGAIFGGGRGAAIGGAAGAAGGTAAAMAGDGDAATLAAGATLTVRLSRPATVSVAP